MKAFFTVIAIVSIVCIVSLILAIVMTIYEHENIHRIIDDCTEPTYNWGWIESTYRCNYYVNRTNEQELAHSINEIVGYNLTILLSSMYLCTFMIIFSILWRNKK